MEKNKKFLVEELEKFVPKIQLIGAMGANGVIGKTGETKLPWSEDETLKWDMENFKTLTTYFPIIMGYKTALTLGKPLKGRYNIFINTHRGERISYPFSVIDGNQINNNLDVLEMSGFLTKAPIFIEVDSLESAIKLIILTNKFFDYEFDKCFIIGGAKTYEEALKKEYPSSLILTSFDESFEGDILFPTKLCKEGKSKYHIYESQDYRNGTITYHEIEDPGWKERIILQTVLSDKS